MFENNTACIDQLKEEYFNGDKMKHISPNFSTLMSFTRTVKLIYNKFDHVITVQTYSQNQYRLQHSESYELTLECINSSTSHNKTDWILRREFMINTIITINGVCYTLIVTFVGKE